MIRRLLRPLRVWLYGPENSTLDTFPGRNVTLVGAPSVSPLSLIDRYHLTGLPEQPRTAQDWSCCPHCDRSCVYTHRGPCPEPGCQTDGAS